MGIAQDLRVAARRWRSVRGGKSASSQAAVERGALRSWFSSLEKLEHSGAIVSAKIYDVEASQLPWLDTRLDLDDGEWVSTFAAGRVVLSDPLDLWVGPQFQLWMRVGEGGAIFNGTRDSHSFRVEAPGRLYLAGYFPGQWGDDSGRISTSLNDYRKFRGGLTVVVIRWRSDAAAGLAALSAADGTGRLAAEQARIAKPVPAPEGWRYLWMLGQSDIFRSAVEDERPCIACHTERNVSILQHDAAFDLTEGTNLRWSWKIDELPSMLREDTQASHDYLSVAVEFENGRDITYTWSAELPAGTGYWCPLPTWKDREFHVVVRSGNNDLESWVDEERDLIADYRRYIGEPPRRVVRVWLIAVSIFQRRRGRAFFGKFVLQDKDGRRLEID
jgi:hypothetical protein